MERIVANPNLKMLLESNAPKIMRHVFKLLKLPAVGKLKDSKQLAAKKLRGRTIRFWHAILQWVDEDSKEM